MLLAPELYRMTDAATPVKSFFKMGGKYCGDWWEFPVIIPFKYITYVENHSDYSGNNIEVRYGVVGDAQLHSIKGEEGYLFLHAFEAWLEATEKRERSAPY